MLRRIGGRVEIARETIKKQVFGEQRADSSLQGRAGDR